MGAGNFRRASAGRARRSSVALRWQQRLHRRPARVPQAPARSDGAAHHQDEARRREDEANTTWIKPELVVEVKFTKWNSNGEMANPRLLYTCDFSFALTRKRPTWQLPREQALHLWELRLREPRRRN